MSSSDLVIAGEPQRSRAGLVFFIVFLLLGGVGAALWFFTRDSGNAETGVVGKVKPRPRPRDPLEGQIRRGFVGVLIARRSLDISALYGGKVEKVLVKLGQRVEKGQLLATLDNASVRHALRAARAALAQAQARAASAQLSYRAARAGYARRKAAAAALSKEAIELARSKAALARAQRLASGAGAGAAAAQVGSLKEKMGAAKIRAPFDGRIAAVYSQAGVLLRARQALVKLIDPNDILVRFAVPGNYSDNVKLGEKVVVKLGDLSQELHGAVQNIAPEIETSSGTLFVEAKMVMKRDSNQRLPLGSIVRVFLPQLLALAARQQEMANRAAGSGTGRRQGGRSATTRIKDDDEPPGSGAGKPSMKSAPAKKPATKK